MLNLLRATGADVNRLTGDGSDGDVAINGATTLSRDTYYDDLTVAAGQTLDPAATGSSSPDADARMPARRSPERRRRPTSAAAARRCPGTLGGSGGGGFGACASAGGSTTNSLGGSGGSVAAGPRYGPTRSRCEWRGVIDVRVRSLTGRSLAAAGHRWRRRRQQRRQHRRQRWERRWCVIVAARAVSVPATRTDRRRRRRGRTGQRHRRHRRRRRRRRRHRGRRDGSSAGEATTLSRVPARSSGPRQRPGSAGVRAAGSTSRARPARVRSHPRREPPRSAAHVADRVADPAVAHDDPLPRGARSLRGHIRRGVGGGRRRDLPRRPARTGSARRGRPPPARPGRQERGGRRRYGHGGRRTASGGLPSCDG